MKNWGSATENTLGNKSIVNQYLIIAIGVEHIIENFLMKDWGSATGNRWDQPDPVSRTTIPQF